MQRFWLSGAASLTPIRTVLASKELEVRTDAIRRTMVGSGDRPGASTIPGILDRIFSLFRRRPSDLGREIARITGTRVRDVRLFEHALVHRSLLRERPDEQLASNERLEFLGDAVLGLAVAEYLYAAFPNRDEGFLTRMRAKLVNGTALAGFAQAVGLAPLVRISDNMERTGGRENQTILADAFEAVLGAVYLDAGLEAARGFILRTLESNVDLEELAERKENYKSLLLEYAQAQGWSQPTYRVVWDRGPSHEKEFCVEVWMNDRPFEHGVAKNKKAAEQLAAQRTLEGMRGV